MKVLLDISTLVLEETVNFTTPSIVHYLLLHVQLSLNFIDSSLLYFLRRDYRACVFNSQGFSQVFLGFFSLVFRKFTK